MHSRSDIKLPYLEGSDCYSNIGRFDSDQLPLDLDDRSKIG